MMYCRACAFSAEPIGRLPIVPASMPTCARAFSSEKWDACRVQADERMRTRRNATRLASCIACQRSRSSAPEVGAPFTGDVDKEPRRTRKTHREPIEFLLRASFVPFVPPCERDQQLSVEYGYLIRTSPLKVLKR